MADVTSPATPDGGRVPSAHRLLGSVPFGDGFRRSLPRRPPLSLAGVFAAMAGAMIASACLTLLSTVDDPSPWLLVVLGIALAAAGWAFGLVVELAGPRLEPRTSELVPLGTVLAVIGVPAFAIGLVAQTTQDSPSASESVAWWPTLLVAVALLVLWVVPGLQGRPVILAVALLAGTWSFAALAAVTVGFDDASSRRPDPSEGLLFEPTPFASFGSIGLGDGLQAAGIVAFGIGLVLLVLAALADRVQLPGLGTPLIVVGVIGGSLGAWAILPDQAVLRALLPLLVIAIAMAVGVLGSRKATTWLAALAGVSALGQLALALLGSDPEPAPVAALLALFGLVLLVTAAALVALRPGPVGSDPGAGPSGPSTGAIPGPPSGPPTSPAGPAATGSAQPSYTPTPRPTQPPPGG